jgi:hypothetical protein
MDTMLQTTLLGCSINKARPHRDSRVSQARSSKPVEVEPSERRKRRGVVTCHGNVQVKVMIMSQGVTRLKVMGHRARNGQERMGHRARNGQERMGHRARNGQERMGHWARNGQERMGHWTRNGQESMGHRARNGQESMGHRARNGQERMGQKTKHQEVTTCHRVLRLMTLMKDTGCLHP